ncbi:MAG: AraC family transcriptional regulator [Chthoniobacterales bacterium]
MYIIGGKVDVAPRHRFTRDANVPFWTFTTHRKGNFTSWLKQGPKFTHDETTFFLAEPHTPYEIYSEGAVIGEIWAHFTPSASLLPLLNWPEEEQGTGRRILNVTDKFLWEKMYGAAQDMVDHINTLDEIQEPLAMHAMEHLFLLAQFFIKNRAEATVQDSRILQVLEMIRQNPAEQWSMRVLANAVNMSETNFAHRFAKEVGISPIRFADTQRMEYAKALLLRTNNPISAISEQLGYANPYHFSNRFQEITGLRPLAFRKNPGG